MSLDDRLSRMETIWSLVQRAHSDSNDEAANARQAIIDRYGGPIRKYLLGAVKNETDAEDLFQDFAVKLLQGSFESADPSRGQFRKLIKTVLYRMVVDFQRRKNRQPVEMDPQTVSVEEQIGANGFAHAWRSLLIDRTFENMKQADVDHQTRLYEILKIRLENPGERSPELANKASQLLKRTIKADNFRALLRRARIQFASLLLDEVAQTLMNPDRESVEEELSELDLLEFCKPVLEDS